MEGENMIIFCSTNLINGTKYIGQDSLNNPKYFGSGTHIKYAIRKYGKKNFVKDILQDGIKTFANLNESEIYWIDYFGADRSDQFYNIAPGGEGNSKVGYSRKGMRNSLEHNAKISAAMKGRKTSPEHLAMRQEIGRVLGKSRLGASITKESKIKRKETLKRKGLIGKGSFGKRNKGAYDNFIKQSRETRIRTGNTYDKQCKPIIQLDRNGNLIARYTSILDAVEKTGFNQGNISNCACGGLKTCSGFIWIYESDFTDELLNEKIKSLNTKYISSRRVIVQLDPNTNEVIRVFDSAGDAIAHINNTSIFYAIKNNTVCGGFRWRYKI